MGTQEKWDKIRQTVKQNNVIIQKQYDRNLCLNKDVPVMDIISNMDKPSTSRKRKAHTIYSANKVRRTTNMESPSRQYDDDIDGLSMIDEDSDLPDSEQKDRRYHIDEFEIPRSRRMATMMKVMSNIEIIIIM